MDRELFQVERAGRECSGDGWVVVGVLPDSDLHPGELQAVERAAQLAYRYFLLTGAPTGVKVRMQCGDVVLVAQYG
jgi:hypothetical protein